MILFDKAFRQGRNVFSKARRKLKGIFIVRAIFGFRRIESLVVYMAALPTKDQVDVTSGSAHSALLVRQQHVAENWYVLNFDQWHLEFPAAADRTFYIAISHGRLTYDIFWSFSPNA
jgi:hypothetical protein